MRALALILPLSILGACDRADERPDASQSATPKQVPTSIIRPEIAPPEPEPSPIETLELVIGFAAGEASLSPMEVSKLEQMIGSPQAAAGGPIRLAAHSDSAGSDAANLAASRERGEAVREWLIANGIAEDRITLVAFGEQNPARPNALPDGAPNAAGRSANRRVEIRIPMAGEPKVTPRQPTLAEEIVEGSDADDEGD